MRYFNKIFTITLFFWLGLQNILLSSSLEKFKNECLEERGIAISTSGTIITPLLYNDLDEYDRMYDEQSRSPDARFVKPVNEFNRLIHECQKEVYSAAPVNVRKDLVFTQYAIFMLGDGSLPTFVGCYEIKNLERNPSSPDKGWAQVTIMLRPTYRNQHIGREVVERMQNFMSQFIKQRPLLYRLKQLPSNSEGYRINVGNPNIDGVFELESFESPVKFKGLQAEIENGNEKSIRVHEKLGWQFIRQDYKDGKVFNIYRFPSSEIED